MSSDLKALKDSQPPPPAEPPAPKPQQLDVPLDTRTTALSVLAVLGLIFAFSWARSVLVPLMIGVLISYALSPVVTWMARLKIPRAVSSGIILLAIAVGLGFLSYGLGEQGAAAFGHLPQSIAKLSRSLAQSSKGPGLFNKVAGQASTDLGKIAGYLGAPQPHMQTQSAAPSGETAPPALNLRQYFLWGSRGVIELITQMIIVLFLSYYLLLSGDLYKRKLVKLAGSTFVTKRITIEILDKVNRQIHRFLLVELLTSVLVGVAMWLELWLFGLEFPGLWGIVAGIIHTVPYVGPTIIVVASGLMALLQLESLKMALLVSGIAALLNGVVDWVLMPVLFGRAAQMNAGAVFVCLLVWSWIWGVWGLLLGIPIMMAIKTASDHIEGLNWLGELLGN